MGRLAPWTGALALALLSSCSIQIGQRAIFAQRGDTLPVMSDDISRSNIELLTLDEVMLRGWYLDRPRSYRLVIFFHGNGLGVSPHAWALDWLAQAFQASVVAVDQRGFGFSEGEPEVGQLVADALLVHDEAVERYGGGKGEVVVVGQSLGTTPAIHVAAERSVAGLILMSPLSGYRDFIDAVARQTPWYVSVKADASLTRLAVNPLRELSKVTAPTLFIHGLADPLSTPKVNQRLFRASPSPWKRDCAVPGGHPSADLTNPLARQCATELAQALSGADFVEP